jgi:predicted SprT family Zn-dependent metalloprotease
MARRAIVIEASEDELPELATLFKTTTTRTTMKSEKTVKATAGNVAGGAGMIGAGEKAKPRRRVLNGMSDNPLLRPLGREVGREKERMGKGKATSSALVAVSASGGVGVSVVEGKEEVLQKKKGKVLRTIGEDLKKAEGPRGGEMVAEILEQLEGMGGSMESMSGSIDMIEGSMDRTEEGQEEIRMLRGMGGAGRIMAVEQALDDDVEVGKVVEGLEGLQLEEDEDVAKPRPRRGRVVKPAAVVRDESEGEEYDSPVVDTRPRRVRTTKPSAIVRAKTPEEEEDSVVEDESDDMSDFIVSDDSSVEEFEEEEEDLSPVPAPKSVRKLVRGRRPDTSSQSEAPKVKETQALHLDWSDDDTKEEIVAPRPLTRRLFPTEKDQNSTGNFEEVCPILTYDPPTSKASRKPAKKPIFTTPPPSPKKALTSPKKAPRIPTATHSPSTDDFWKADVVNDWNDEFSPQKPLRSLKLAPSTEDLAGSPRKAAPAKKDKELIERKKKFNENKHAIALSFLRELDEEITDGKVSALAASTGGVTIVWSKKLNTTAGRANWKREAIRTRPLGSAPPTTTYRHHASIELAEKVIDDEDRLLNVVAHEFCHLANFMVSGVTNNPHGKEFKAWASRCSARFGGRGIEVTTKHSYEIAFKYVWQCTEVGCRLEFKRHSKSIDPKRHTCGLCKGRLVQTRPVPRGEVGGLKVMGEYQAYVKENIGRVRKENLGSPQKDIMALVGRGYRELKAERLKGLGKSGLLLESGRDEKEVEDDPVEAIVKKIDFLDLTTP